MIVACPSCATRYDFPASRFSGSGAMVRCSACGHSWIECGEVEVIDVPTRNLPAMIEAPPDTDREVKRLVDASLVAEEAFEANRLARRRRLRDWAVFTAAIFAPFLLAALFPEQVVRAAPAAARFYERAGIAVNIYGLDIRHIQQKHMILEGTRVLTITGDIVNVSGFDRKVPSLRFVLRDRNAQPVYAWTVESSVRPVRPGEMTNFTTRVASPPLGAEDVQIRFARIDEIGSNDNP